MLSVRTLFAKVCLFTFPLSPACLWPGQCATCLSGPCLSGPRLPGPWLSGPCLSALSKQDLYRFYICFYTFYISFYMFYIGLILKNWTDQTKYLYFWFVLYSRCKASGLFSELVSERCLIWLFVTVSELYLYFFGVVLELFRDLFGSFSGIVRDLFPNRVSDS